MAEAVEAVTLRVLPSTETQRVLCGMKDAVSTPFVSGTALSPSKRQRVHSVAFELAEHHPGRHLGAGIVHESPKAF